MKLIHLRECNSAGLPDQFGRLLVLWVIHVQADDDSVELSHLESKLSSKAWNKYKDVGNNYNN